jgi:heptosyltransferase-2
MPALQALRRRRPDAHIVILSKAGVLPLWDMHGAPDATVELEKGLAGTWHTAARLRRLHAREAYVLPLSFRSALLPFTACIPARIGLPGHARDTLLTRVVHVPADLQVQHQAREYQLLLAPEMLDRPIEPPLISAPECADELTAAFSRLPQPVIGLLPGAARGPSKRWPTAHFTALGKRLIKERQAGIVLMGSTAEIDTCRAIIQEWPAGTALNLAGQTSLPQWAASLGQCAAVVANDSGGMHLSAALGCPTIALYGITDPARTGPLGARCCILQKSRVRSRRVARDSAGARDAMAAITPNEVFESVLQYLE